MRTPLLNPRLALADAGGGRRLFRITYSRPATITVTRRVGRKDMNEPKLKRRWFRFSLRTLLVVIALLCIWLGIITQRANKQRTAVVAVRNAGGKAHYYNGYNDSGEILTGYRPHGPEWLLNLLGYDYFGDIIEVELDDKQITDELVAQLKNLQELRQLSLRGVPITESALAQLSELPTLEYLDLALTPITLAGCEKLGKFRA